MYLVASSKVIGAIDRDHNILQLEDLSGLEKVCMHAYACVVETTCSKVQRESARARKRNVCVLIRITNGNANITMLPPLPALASGNVLFFECLLTNIPLSYHHPTHFGMPVLSTTNTLLECPYQTFQTFQTFQRSLLIRKTHTSLGTHAKCSLLYTAAYTLVEPPSPSLCTFLSLSGFSEL